MRSLHYQIRQPQGKLVRVTAGEVFDVAADIHRSSPTFGKWVTNILSAENKKQMWIPVGFAHGFLVLSDHAEVLYKTTDFYAEEHERCIAWNDPVLAIHWPINGQPLPVTEADVFFNTAVSWNAYPGNLLTAQGGDWLYDFLRVAVHEFGHAAGLDHPDAIGQNVPAIMNSFTGDTYTLQPDDITGAHAIQWMVAEPRRLDFNADTRSDMLWRNASTGQNHLWLMNGLTLSSSAPLRQVANPNWVIAGNGDLNGDGRSDVVWRNVATGQTYAWLMNGQTIAAEGVLRQVPDLNWVIVGVADIDGDRRADIVWRHKLTGDMYAWRMDGLTIGGEGHLRQVSDQNWTIAGLADLDGDGRADILWRHKLTGQIYAWLVAGPVILAEGYIRQVADQNWAISGLADLNGDGKADIVWRNAAPASAQFGQNYLWLMNGAAIANQGYLNTVPSTDWTVVNR